VAVNLDDEELFPGCHEAAGVLKLFLRELPTPLLSYDIYPQLLAVAGALFARCTRPLKSSTTPWLTFPVVLFA
jgi:hypothetical protein